MGGARGCVVAGRTAGVRSNPALVHFCRSARVATSTPCTLQVRGLDHVWVADDNAQVPDLAAEEGV